MLRPVKLISTFLLILFFMPAAISNAGESNYLFERNRAQFGNNIDKVGERSFKYLAKVEAGKNAKELLLYYNNIIQKVAKEKGYVFQESPKGLEWRYAEKRYFDTPNRDLYKKGYVIRENYRFPEGAQPDPNKFVLTVKEMSPNDLMRLVNSTLGPAPGSTSLVKFEENISLDNKGIQQSYFETAIGAKVNNSDLGNRTLGDYGKLYPELLKLGLPADTKLQPVIAYSVQIKYGSFELPDGFKAKGDIEVWTDRPGGKPYVIELAFDGTGYAASAEHQKAMEDFFNKVMNEGMKQYVMPNAGPYMGSKVRVLFDEKKQ